MKINILYFKETVDNILNVIVHLKTRLRWNKESVNIKDIFKTNFKIYGKEMFYNRKTLRAVLFNNGIKNKKVKQIIRMFATTRMNGIITNGTTHDLAFQRNMIILHIMNETGFEVEEVTEVVNSVLYALNITPPEGGVYEFFPSDLKAFDLTDKTPVSRVIKRLVLQLIIIMLINVIVLYPYYKYYSASESTSSVDNSAEEYIDVPMGIDLLGNVSIKEQLHNIMMRFKEVEDNYSTYDMQHNTEGSVERTAYYDSLNNLKISNVDYNNKSASEFYFYNNQLYFVYTYYYDINGKKDNENIMIFENERMILWIDPDANYHYSADDSSHFETMESRKLNDANFLLNKVVWSKRD